MNDEDIPPQTVTHTKLTESERGVSLSDSTQSRGNVIEKSSLVPLRESRLSFHISHIKTRILLSHLPLL